MTSGSKMQRQSEDEQGAGRKMQKGRVKSNLKDGGSLQSVDQVKREREESSSEWTHIRKRRKVDPECIEAPSKPTKKGESQNKSSNSLLDWLRNDIKSKVDDSEPEKEEPLSEEGQCSGVTERVMNWEDPSVEPLQSKERFSDARENIKTNEVTEENMSEEQKGRIVKEYNNLTKDLICKHPTSPLQITLVVADKN